MLYQVWIFSGLFLWYGDLWDSHIIPVTTSSCHSWCPVHHHVTSMECLVGKRLCGCSVSDPCPFCQESQTECTLWTLQGPLRSTCGFAAFLVTAATKKNLEWESWSKFLPLFNGSTGEGAAGHLQGTYGTMGKGEKK